MFKHNTSIKYVSYSITKIKIITICIVKYTNKLVIAFVWREIIDLFFVSLKGGEIQGPGDQKQLEELGGKLGKTLGSLHQGSEWHQWNFSGSFFYNLKYLFTVYDLQLILFTI